MNGAHDMGGSHGFGPIVIERDEPVFHAEWERRCFALTVAASATGTWNLDMSRHARENQAPGKYLSSSYYQIWLTGLEAQLLAHHLVTKAELQSGHATGKPGPVKRTLRPEDVEKVLARGAGIERAIDAKPAFEIGAKVRVRKFHPRGHTRAPRYVRGQPGRVARIHGGHVFPDANAAGQGEAPQYCYSIRFEAGDLWGDGAHLNHAVYVDLWESYLERAP